MLRNNLYYRLKPLIPKSVRMGVRRHFAQRTRTRSPAVWPIMPGSERPPEDWAGWPEGKQFAVVLTHDVEGRTGLARSRQLMQLELELGFRSSFNFIPEGTYRVSEEQRNELTANGFEVGVHDLEHDGRLYRSHPEFLGKARRINRYLKEWDAVGFRSGFMLHKLAWLHELEIQYDMSTFDTDPFEPQPEGRYTIFPFWVPSADGSLDRRSTSDRSRRGYVELPYTLPQDSTLFLLLGETSPEIWMRKVDWVAKHGGMVLLDTHPDYMAFTGTPRRRSEYPVRYYQQLLEYLATNYAGAYWHALPRDVAAHALTGRRSPAIGVERALERAAVPHVVSLNGRTRVGPDDGVVADLDRGTSSGGATLRGKHAAVILFSHYPADPRPRRAAEALAAEGVTIDLICLRDSSEEPAEQQFGPVNVRRVPLKRYRGGKLGYVAQYFTFLFICFGYLTVRTVRRRYDLVHVHNMPDVLVFSALIPKLFGAKIILDLHDPMPELMQTIFKLPEQSLSVRVLKRLEKWSIAFADAVLTVNRACQEIYSSRSCEADKIKVVINSPDDEVFRFRAAKAPGGNGAAPTKPFVILYHGSLVRRNGFDLAVDALSKISTRIPSARLRVCGARTKFFDEVIEEAQRRGLRDRIDYLGVKNLTGIVEAIDGCDLGIIPNHRNIFTEINTPTRIFEYLALGKPVIAPRAKGIQDYFGDNDLIFFELGDADDLAAQIVYAFSNPADVREIVGRGQKVYLEHTWSRERLGMIDTIAALVSQSGRRPTFAER